MRRAVEGRFSVSVLGLFAMCWAFSAGAHVGSPTVFFEGQAGPYPVQVMIQPAEVIPGLAEISVRTRAGGVERVTALPMKWNAGRKGAPPPDIAQPVRGETNLYHAQLWFMEPGAQSVELELSGKSGPGRVTIPVDAVATRVLTMPRGLGTVLAVLGILLVSLLISIAGAAVRESMVAPGEAPTGQRRRAAFIAMAGGAALLATMLWGGWRWWNASAVDYRDNRLYRPMRVMAEVRTENGDRILRLRAPAFAKEAPLVPDHGKLMHVFLMREPGLDVFAHLHPLKRDQMTFDSLLPDLPAGSYRVYGDVTYETGASDTLTVAVTVPEKAERAGGAPGPVTADEDDSWLLTSPLGAGAGVIESRLSPDYVMTWQPPARITVREPLSLHFTVRDAQGKPANLEPYLGMRGHLALRREDGAVFTHLHPGGSASMAAMQLSTLRAEGKLPLQAAFGQAEPICRLPKDLPGEQPWLRGSADGEGVAFPYAFPRPGRYRMWTQVKLNGKILTGVFDVEVQEAGRRMAQLVNGK